MDEKGLSGDQLSLYARHFVQEGYTNKRIERSFTPFLVFSRMAEEHNLPHFRL
jgi:hypothetical protein